MFEPQEDISNNNYKFLEKLLYDYFKYKITNLIINKESNEYGACLFNLNGIKFLYRNAKITPTKIGQFVTVWKRSDNKITIPYSLNDALDYYIISVQKDAFMGYFIFPINILHTNGIVSDLNGNGGRRGFRVYPIWDKPDNKQAEKTQKWQISYFLDCSNLSLDNKTTETRFRKLIKRLFTF